MQPSTSAMIAAYLSVVVAFSAAAAPAPEDPVAKVWELYDAGRAGDAFHLLRAKLRRFPEDPALHRAYQLYGNNSGQLEAIASEYEVAYSSRPTDLNAYFLACAQPSVRESRAVVERAKRAGVKGPYLSWATASFQAYDLLAAGKPEAAAAKLNASDGGRLDPFLWNLAIAQTWLQRGGPAAAAEHLDRARAAQPRDPRGFELQGWLRLIAGDTIGFGRTLDEAGKLGDFAFLHDALAYKFLMHGDLESMRREYKAALAAPRDWTNDSCYRISATAALGQNLAASGLAQSEYLADSAQTCAVPYIVAQLLREGRAEDALAFAEKAAAHNPLDVSALAALAMAQGARGRHLDAAATGRKALRLAPKHPSLLTSVGASYARDRRCDLADRYFRAAFNVTNHLPELNREYGCCHLERHNYAESLDHFSRLRLSGAEPRQAWWGLSRSYEGTGRLDRAVSAMEKTVSLDEDPVAKAGDKAELARLRLDAEALDRHFPADLAAVRRRLRRVPVMAERRVAAFLHGSEGQWLAVPWEAKPIAAANEGEQRGEGQKWSPDGRRVFYILPDGVMSLDLASGATSYVVRHAHRFKDKYPGPRRAVLGILVSKDGRSLYTLSSRGENRRAMDDTVEAIDLATGKESPLRDAQKAVRDSADGAAFGSYARVVLSLPGEPTDPPETTCGAHADAALDGRIVCVAGGEKTDGADDDELAIYDPKTRKKEYVGAAGSFPVWSPDGRKVAYLWRERELRIYDAAEKKIESLDSGFSPDFANPDGLQWARKRPQWTSDSRFIMYTLGSVLEGEREHPGAAMTLVADLERGEVWASDGNYFDFVWSPSTAPYAGPR